MNNVDRHAHPRVIMLAAITVAVLAGTVAAQTLHVPSQYPTIQQAVNAAPNGATIVVAPGTYDESVSIWNQTLTIVSSHGPEETIFEVAGEGYSFFWLDDMGPGTKLEGFTFRGGEKVWDPLIYTELGSLIIDNCVFEDSVWGVIEAWDMDQLVIQNSTIRNNSLGVYIESSSAEVTNSTFENNSSGSSGAAIYSTETNLTINDSEFLNNTSGSGHGGAVRVSQGTVTVNNSEFTQNTANAEGGGIAITGTSSSSISGSTFQDNSSALGWPGQAVHLSQNASAVPISNSFFCGHDGSHIIGNWSDGGGNTFESECEGAPVCPSGFQQSCYAPNGDITSCSFECWSGSSQTLTIGDGSSNVQAGWSINTFNKGWFSGIGPSMEIAHAAGVTEVSQITDASQYDFVAMGSVGPICDETCSPTGVGEFLVLRNANTGHYGVLRVDEINFVSIVPPLEAYAAGRWWFHSSGGTDFSEGSAPAPQTLHVPSEYPTIQAAINAAAFNNGDTVLVAPGTYNEAITFGGKTITVKSSGGADVTTIDASGLDQTAVLVPGGSEEGTQLEGFTITGGNAVKAGVNTIYGGGLRVDPVFGTSAVITVSDCIFTGNTAEDGGGAAAALGAADATFENCTFIGNSSMLRGGAVLALGGGGDEPTMTFVNCTFDNNSTVSAGGALNINVHAHAVLIDCLLTSNFSGSSGGGLFAGPGTTVDITGSTISGNSADSSGGGAHVGGPLGEIPAAIVNITSSEVCNNSPNDFSGEPWNDLGGNTIGEACVPDNNAPDNPDPVTSGESVVGSFAGATQDGTSSCEPDGVDLFFLYTVTSGPVTLALDTCGSTADTALAVFDASDAELGCSTTCGGDPCAGAQACLTVSDLSAGEYLIRLSKVPSTTAGGEDAFVLNISEADSTPLGDLNGDGVVNVFDLLELLAAWGNCAECSNCPADLDGNCAVNVFDLLVLLANWG